MLEPGNRFTLAVHVTKHAQKTTRDLSVAADNERERERETDTVACSEHCCEQNVRIYRQDSLSRK